MPPDHWPEIALADLMSIEHGFAFPGQGITYHPPGDILLTPGNFAIGGGFKGNKFKYFEGVVPEGFVLNEGDLFVSMTDLSKSADTLGSAALVPRPTMHRFLHNQRLGRVRIRDGERLDARFASYLLRSASYRNEVLAGATGTTVKHTSPARILGFRAAIPPLGEQLRVCDINVG